MNDTSKSKTRRGIQSVEIGYRILRIVQDAGGPVLLKDIAQLAEMGTSAVHNYLVSLTRVGLLQSDGRGAYRVGPSAFSLGLVALQQVDGFDIVRDGVEALRNRTRMTASVAIWGDEGPVVIFKQDGIGQSVPEFRPGMLLTPLNSSAGRAFVASLDTAVTAHILSKHSSHNSSLKNELKKVREEFTTFGYVVKEFFGQSAEFRAISAPIRDDGGIARYVVSLIGPVTEFASDRNNTYASALIEETNKISGLLGFRGH